MKEDNAQELFKILNFLNQTKKDRELSLDDEQRQNILNIYKPIAKMYLSGQLAIEGRYKFVFTSFIKALGRYKVYLQAQLKAIESVSNVEYLEMRKNLESLEVDQFIIALKSLFAGIPHQIVKNTNESFYHIFIHIILKLIGCDFKSEDSTNLGRIDGVLKTDTHIVIIEFKMNSSEVALAQIREKKYYQKFMNSNKKILLLGIGFDNQEKNISNHILEEINED